SAVLRCVLMKTPSDYVAAGMHPRPIEAAPWLAGGEWLSDVGCGALLLSFPAAATDATAHYERVQFLPRRPPCQGPHRSASPCQPPRISRSFRRVSLRGTSKRSRSASLIQRVTAASKP